MKKKGHERTAKRPHATWETAKRPHATWESRTAPTCDMREPQSAPMRHLHNRRTCTSHIIWTSVYHAGVITTQLSFCGVFKRNSFHNHTSVKLQFKTKVTKLYVANLHMNKWIYVSKILYNITWTTFRVYSYLQGKRDAHIQNKLHSLYWVWS